MFNSDSISQARFDIKFDWGKSAFSFHESQTDVFIAVDVFSFSYFIEHCEHPNVYAFSRLQKLKPTSKPILLGCLRNAKAVANEAQILGKKITVVALGDEIGLLGFRPNFEDLMGAGAIISFLNGSKSTQAESAQDSFEYNLADMSKMLSKCSGGKLLLSHSSDEELGFVAQINAAINSPYLRLRPTFT